MEEPTALESREEGPYLLLPSRILQENTQNLYNQWKVLLSKNAVPPPPKKTFTTSVRECFTASAEHQTKAGSLIVQAAGQEASQAYIAQRELLWKGSRVPDSGWKTQSTAKGVKRDFKKAFCLPQLNLPRAGNLWFSKLQTAIKCLVQIPQTDLPNNLVIFGANL